MSLTTEFSPSLSTADALLNLIISRRSVTKLTDPAPSQTQLDTMLRAAASVPDHGRLQPWRFVVVSGEARDRWSAALVAGALEAQPDLPADRLAKVRGKAFAAPTSIAVIARMQPGTNVPDWEQVASASCAGYAITLAASALGLGAVWKSVFFVDAPALQECFSMTTSEQLLGWIHVGTPATDELPTRVPGKPLSDVVSVLPPH